MYVDLARRFDFSSSSFSNANVQWRKNEAKRERESEASLLLFN